MKKLEEDLKSHSLLASDKSVETYNKYKEREQVRDDRLHQPGPALTQLTFVDL